MKILFKAIKWLLILFFVSSILSVIVYRFVPVYVTPLMIIRSVRPYGTESQQESMRHWHHEWVPLDEMSKWMPKAVVASEDGFFYDHHGFDTKAIKAAYEYNKTHEKQRGASTISQQTAKNVFLWPGRNIVRKGLEAYFTVLIEIFWSKDRIMEVYLNSIEMGPGIYGVEAASRHYFGTDAGKLSKRQCALIACALPNPIKMNPGNPGPYLSRRASKIVRYM